MIPVIEKQTSLQHKKQNFEQNLQTFHAFHSILQETISLKKVKTFIHQLLFFIQNIFCTGHYSNLQSTYVVFMQNYVVTQI